MIGGRGKGKKRGQVLLFQGKGILALHIALRFTLRLPTGEPSSVNRFHQGETASTEPEHDHQSSSVSSASHQNAINGAGRLWLRPILKSVFPLEAGELVGRRW